MKTITWNIQQGGGSRVDEILEIITCLDADTVVLTEFKANRNGDTISQALQESGLIHQAVASSSGENTVALMSKHAFEPMHFKSELGKHAQRCVGARFQDHHLFGFYFPQKDEKFDVFQFVLKHLKDYLAPPTLLIGDFNTGKHYQDEANATFKCAELFEMVERKGWVDLWRQLNGRTREYSWYSNAGNGFRIDHAFGSTALAKKVEAAYYDHAPRESGVSDHSLLCVEWMS